MADNPRWTRRPAGSTWGDFGPDDQLGRLEGTSKNPLSFRSRT
jgi:hypothetical protein